MIEIIYSYPNERKQTKDYWNQSIKSFFDNKAKSSISGENHIQFVSRPFKTNGKAKAWKCVFPNLSKIKSREFGWLTTQTDSKLALQQAIKYRDSSIKTWIDTINRRG